ncbi:AbrB/MazE/SpoVT family DNA-binding domain-containing protein [Candidatus Gottesmanbacteria bacterium]|nr:AbrB/MazE/SpoVT family DNA-binding domain-containing protein [Candidatus Gottesmanbacteria bacterium]
MNTLLTLTSKNQLTLPVSIVSLLELSKGSKMWTKVKDNTIILEKAEDDWDSLQGLLANHPISKKYSTLQIIEIAKKKEAQRLARKYGK